MNSCYRFVLFALLLIAGNSFAQRPLYLQSGTMTPPANLEEFIASAAPAISHNGYYYRLIQFQSLPGSAQKQSLKNGGIKLLEYLPTNAYFAAIPLTFNKNLLRQAGVVSVLELQASQKVNKRLLSEGLPVHALKASGKAEYQIQYSGNLSLNEAISAASRWGEISFTREGIHSLGLIASETDLMALAAQAWVFYVSVPAPPSVPDDTKGRSLHRSNMINSDFVTGRHYDGSGVTVAIADDGFVGPHIDFSGRMTNFATVTGGTHGDMTSGICVGSGNLDPTIRGMATGAYLYTYDIGGYPHIINAVNNYNTLGTVITSTSYSQGCNEYTSDTEFGDQTINQNGQLEFVFSAGNNGSGDCGYGAGGGWGNITGGYKQGKNVIACGNLDALEVLDPSSSRGPASDGRIKPDICANGRDQLSTNENNTYQVGGGTSAASPGVAGLTAQLYQAYRELNGGQNPSTALLKACMLNSAEDIGNPGPDYTYGWGRVNAYRALTTIEDNRFIADSIGNGATQSHNITVPANVSQVRVMIYWHDAEGSPLASRYLVNDINMYVSDPSAGAWTPWVLDPTPAAAALSAPAVRGIDSLNNMEQVTLDNPVAGTYTVNVFGNALPFGTQKYYIVWEFRTPEITLTYPNGGEGFVPGSQEVIRWDATKGQGNFTLEYSTDNGSNWSTISSTIGQNTLQYTWTVPNNIAVSGQGLIRVSRGPASDTNDTLMSFINVPSNVTVDWACPDSIRLIWAPVNGASGYQVYKLGTKYMEPVATSTTNDVILTGVNPIDAYWFSVAAITPQGGIGRRGNAIYKAPGVFACPLAVDASVSAIASPSSGSLQSCQDNSAVPVSVLIENKGQNPISNIPVAYSLNGSLPVSEVVPGPLAPFASVVHTFSSTIDLSNQGLYQLSVISSYGGDLNAYNDSALTLTTVIPGQLVSLPWLEDFESQSLCGTASDCELTVCTLTGGWINETNLDGDDIDFRTNQGATPSGSTGPDVDHTLGTNAGNYLYLEASGGCFDKTASLVSPCIDLSSAGAPQLLFWAHMYGGAMGELHVDVYSEGSWNLDVIPAYTGDQGNNWFQVSVNLVAYAGEIVNIRFRGITGADFTSDLAIDDISILETNAPPVTNFTASANSGCINKVVTFSDLSLNAPSAWNWTFTPNTVTFMNGTTASSSSPDVQFNAAGSYDVKLVVTNSFGSDSLTQTSIVQILNPAALPVTEDFQAAIFPPTGWEIVSAPSAAYTWDETALATGSNGQLTECAWVDNFSYNAIGTEDNLQSFQIQGAATAMRLYFDVAHARYDNTYSDGLRVDISTDCGVSWQPSGYLKTGSDLATVPNQTNPYTPSLASDWRRDTVDLSAFQLSSFNVRFVNINGYGNNVYIDNVNIDFASSLNENTLGGIVSVFPNPSSGLFRLQLRDLNAQSISLEVMDLSGRVLQSRQIEVNGEYNGSIDLSKQADGMYMLRLKGANGINHYRLIKH